MGGAKTLSIIIAANIKGLETSMAKANKTIGSFASNAARLGSMLWEKRLWILLSTLSNQWLKYKQ